MKRLLLITTLILGSMSIPYLARASTLIASYPSSNYSTYAPLDGNDYLYAGQDFQVSQSSLVLDSVNFYLSKSGTPTGNAYAVLYAMTGSYGSGGKPTGSPLATSAAFDVSTLTGSNQTITFTFSGTNRISLINGTYYCIVINYTGGGSPDYVHVGLGNTSLSGDSNYSFDGSSWTYYENYNAIFYVYGMSSGNTTSTTSPDLSVQGTMSVQGKLQVQ